jgi:YesN/AraC family two-component response regulator
MTSPGILVVDDDKMVLEVLSRQLGGMGYEVSTATNGQEAWDMVQKKEYEIIITDLEMPKMTGQELIEKVKNHSPATVVIVLTGFGSLDTARESIHAGCDEFLLKPLEDVKLVKLVIKRCLHRHRLLMEAIVYKQTIHKAAKGLGGPVDNLIIATNGLVLSIEEKNTDRILKLAEVVKTELEYIVYVAEELHASSERLKAADNESMQDDN